MDRTIDPAIHIGETYGRLTIIGYDHKDQFGRYIYRVRCTCGNEKLVAYTSMRTGHTTSCGCYNREVSSTHNSDEHIGETYGRLTIIAFDHKDGGKIYYNCRCTCGNEKVIRYDQLKSGSIKSCGCYNRDIHSKNEDEHIGETWGRLTIIAFDHTDQYYNRFYKVRCSCGTEKVVTYASLKHGKVVSCGCYGREIHTKHGMSHDHLYRVWKNILDRCTDPRHHSYVDYGGRGIRMCDEWIDPVQGLFRFRDWALANGCREDLTIDRIDNDGIYEPSNCRWVTLEVQGNNKRANVYIAYMLNEDSNPPYLVYTYAEWARILNIDYFNFRNRILKHGSTKINEIIEQCYREGHGLSADEPFEMHVGDEVVSENHINNFRDSIHD